MVVTDNVCGLQIHLLAATTLRGGNAFASIYQLRGLRFKRLGDLLDVPREPELHSQMGFLDTRIGHCVAGVKRWCLDKRMACLCMTLQFVGFLVFTVVSPRCLAQLRLCQAWERARGHI